MLRPKVSRASARSLLLIVLLALVPIVFVWWVAQAASRNWTGGTPGDPTCAPANAGWTDRCNWGNQIAPVANDDLTFPGSQQPTSVNNFASGFAVNSISITGTHLMQGNGVSLSSGITATSGQISLASIKLINSQTFNAPAAGTSTLITSTIDNNGKTLTLDGAGTFALIGAISGAGGLTKRGAGTIVLGATNLYTGTTLVSEGTLLVSGSQKDSFVSIANGGTLGGSGTVGPINVNSSTSADPGRISPGGVNHGTGVLSAEGQVSFLGTGVKGFDVDLKSTTLGSGYDQLKVNGAVNLGTATGLNVSLGFTPAPGSKFVIIDNDGTDSINGTFSNHPERSVFPLNGMTFLISYRGGDGNDVELSPLISMRRWDGGSGADNKWQTKENWEGDVAPSPGDDLVFPSGAARLSNENDFASDTVFNSISFAGPSYTLAGNAIGLNNGISGSVAAPSNSIQFASIKLISNQTFSSANNSLLGISSPIDTNGKTLSLNGDGKKFLSGNISGTGGLVVNGPGQVEIRSNPTSLFSGPTIMNSGSLRLGSRQPNSQLQLKGGIVDGGGTVNSIIGTDGTLQLDAGILGSSSITSDHAVTLNSAVTFEVGLVDGAFGTDCGRLIASEGVDLGSSTLLVNTLSFDSVDSGDSFRIIDKTSTGPVQGTFNNLPEGGTLLAGGIPFRITYVGGDGNDVVLVTNSNLVFSANSYIVGEGDQRVNFTLLRFGDTSGPASVNVITLDGAGSQNCNVVNGQASSRCDYTIAFNTILFASGETSRSFSIPIVDDSYAEGNEIFTVHLNSSTGVSLSITRSVGVTVVDNETTAGPNPIADSGFFIRQQYLDFFSREPDPGGFAFWVGTINSCGLDSQCVEAKRVNGSAAFYISIEFQATGYLVERIYKTAYGDATGTSVIGGSHQLAVPIIRLNEFLPDTQQIGRGVVVGQGNWEQTLENNKRAFMEEFVQRPRFLTALPTAMTAAQFVDQLNTNAGQPLSQSERDQLVNELSLGMKSRAQVLRAIAEDPDLDRVEFNRAFVLMQYFGYLRRNPFDAPEPTLDFSGYDFWLTKLNQFSGNFVNAEMVKAFITSGEYQQRFGP